MSKVSVVIATYNGEKYISKQLESILNQTRRPDEVIIRDDCSNDSTSEIVSEFIQKNNLNWKLIRGKENLGFEKNFAESLKHATGEIIFLCDQDDVWNTCKIQIMTAVMDRNRQILCLNSGYSCIDQNGLRIHMKSMPFTSNNGLIIGKRIKKNGIAHFSAKDVLKYNISMGCTLAFRRDLLDEFFENENGVPHDWLINLIAAQKGGLYFYNKELIKYRLHSNNTIGQDNRFIQEIKSRDKLYEGIIKDYQLFQRTKLVNSNIELRNTCLEMRKFYNVRRKIIRKRFTFKDLRMIIANQIGLSNLFLVRDFLIRIRNKRP